MSIPDTMSPYQHGEVFVLDDGAETDLDLGHYERFIDIRLNRASNTTTGQVYAEVIGKERRGDYLGGTIQVIPHITNEIKRRIGLVAKSSGAEIILVEVGGTVGDIESQPFLEALRQLRYDLGRENTLFVHVTWLPYIGATGELKTKPTQHSVRELRSIGISPDVIVARSDHPIDDTLCDKIATFCDVDRKAVIPMVTNPILYEVPLMLEKSGIADTFLHRLGLEARHEPDWTNGRRWWRRLPSRTSPGVKIALVGKYVELHDAYISVHEALKHAGICSRGRNRPELGAFGRAGKRPLLGCDRKGGWHSGAGRFWQPGDRRQNPGGTLCAHQPGPLPGIVPGDAAAGGRICPLGIER